MHWSRRSTGEAGPGIMGKSIAKSIAGQDTAATVILARLLSQSLRTHETKGYPFHCCHWRSRLDHTHPVVVVLAPGLRPDPDWTRQRRGRMRRLNLAWKR